MLLGYYRITHRQFFVEMSYEAITKSKDTLPLDLIADRKDFDYWTPHIYVADSTIELILPLVILLTGSKLAALCNIIHLVITPMILFNPLLKDLSQFQIVMSIMTVLQLLGMLMFMSMPAQGKIKA